MLSLILFTRFMKGLWFFKADCFFDFLIQVLISTLLFILTCIAFIFEMQYILIGILIGFIIFILYLIYKKLEEG